ncbi:hypothetical protein [Natrononativus amylolyticus]|uniref:hypothetical protein n=1 Tax=Natrononativus amylolyticus TaxID=2963434 RepID=UPI0020CFB1B4|nr:hypothetical protein [Natrononativus amylolyticus]
MRHRGPDTSWYLHFGDGTILADALEHSTPAPTVGDRGEYFFGFVPVSGRQQTHRKYDHLERYDLALEKLTYAGAYVLKPTESSRYYWTEQTPPGADSLLIGLEPAEPEKDPVPGLWGLIDGGNPRPPVGRSACGIEFSVMKVAPFNEYDSHDEVTADLQWGT